MLNSKNGLRQNERWVTVEPVEKMYLVFQGYLANLRAMDQYIAAITRQHTIQQRLGLGDAIVPSSAALDKLLVGQRTDKTSALTTYGHIGILMNATTYPMEIGAGYDFLISEDTGALTIIVQKPSHQGHLAEVIGRFNADEFIARFDFYLYPFLDQLIQKLCDFLQEGTEDRLPVLMELASFMGISSSLDSGS